MWKKAIAFLLLPMALLAASCTVMNTDVPDPVEPAEAVTVGGGMTVSGGTETHGIALRREELTEDDKIALASLFLDVETSFVVSATVQPDIADEQVSWSLRWAEDDSRNVANYVELNVLVQSHTELNKAAVSCKQPFDKQIELVCTSCSKTSVSAVTKIDYVQRVTYLIDPVLGGNTFIVSKGTPSQEYDYPEQSLQVMTEDTHYIATIHDGNIDMLEYGTGTVEPELRFNVQIYPSYAMMRNSAYPFEPEPELHSYNTNSDLSSTDGRTFTLDQWDMERMIYGNYTLPYLYRAMKEYQENGGQALTVNLTIFSVLPKEGGSDFTVFHRANYTRQMEANLTKFEEMVEGGAF